MNTNSSHHRGCLRFLHVWAPPLLLCCVFLIFALYGFGTVFPPGLNHDAAWHGLYAFRILNGEPWTIYTPESFGHETPYSYFMAAIFAIFGASKEAIEATATVFGLLSVPFFYRLMLARSRNSWVAFGLGLLWVSGSALVLYSRVGWRLVTLIPAALLVIMTCRFYLDDTPRHRLWAAAIGVSTGITLYTYNGGRAILLFVPMFWLVRCLQSRFTKSPSNAAPIGSTLADAALSLGVWLLVSAPMLWFAVNNWQVWNGRAASLMGDSSGIAGKMSNLTISLGYFNFSARGDDFFTNFPVLEGPMSWMWIAGVMFAIFRFRVYWPELLLLGVFLLPGIVTRPSFHRAIGTLPVIYVMACYFLLSLQKQMQGKLGRKRGTLLFSGTLALIVALQIGAGWKKLYIEKQPFAWGFYPETTVVGRYIHANPTEKFVVYAGNWPQDALTFLSTTDSAHPGQNFVNYQGYNTPSGDGLPEIIRDLDSGLILRPIRFVVDPPKVEALLKALSSKYTVQEEGGLANEGASVARIFLVE